MNVKIGNETVLSIDFKDSLRDLQNVNGWGNPDGFVVFLPVDIFLKGSDGYPRVFFDLMGSIRLSSGTEVGSISIDGVLGGNSKDNKTGGIAEWRGSFAALEAIESSRNGNGPDLLIRLLGKTQLGIKQNEGGFNVASLPSAILMEDDLQIPVEAWSKIVLKIGGVRHLIVELPIVANVDPHYQSVYQGITKAQAALAKGGAISWHSAIVSLRKGLEDWRDFEPIKFNVNSVTSTTPDAKLADEMTAKEKMAAIRWWLFRFCSEGTHDHPNSEGRADVLFALATLSGLLAAGSAVNE